MTALCKTAVPAAFRVEASRLGAAGVAPTSTLLGVARLAIPSLMVELEVTAVG